MPRRPASDLPSPVEPLRSVVAFEDLPLIQSRFGPNAIWNVWKPFPCTTCDGKGAIPEGISGCPRCASPIPAEYAVCRECRGETRNRMVDGRPVCPRCLGSGLGPQLEVFRRREFELFWGASRGPGKSAAGTAWLTAGNYDCPLHFPNGSPDLVNLSYLYHPRYSALVLRRNLDDLGNWITHHAKPILGGQGMFFAGASAETGGPSFRHPSGARVVLGHMEDSNAWEKYQGHEYHRVMIEELGQCPDQRLYTLIMSSCRSSFQTADPEHPGLIPQMFLSANPIGRGFAWVRDRFVKARDEAGNLIPPLTTISDPANPRHTRVFIPASIYDNPKFNPKYPDADRDYIARLKQLPEKERRAMLEGDWEALVGSFFCCDAETEVLVEGGFKRIADVRSGERAATRAPDGTLEFLPCAVHQFAYSGPMVSYRTPQVDFLVTPNHRMYCEPFSSRRPPQQEWRFIEAARLPAMSRHPRTARPARGASPGAVTIRGFHRSAVTAVELLCPVCGKSYQTTQHQLRFRRGTTCSRACSYVFRSRIYGKKGSYPPTLKTGEPRETSQTFPVGDWMEFLGWWLSEGSVDYYRYRTSSGALHRHPNTVVISQSAKSPHLQRIRDLLKRLGLHFLYKGHGFRVFSTVLSAWFAALGRSSEKYIPAEFMTFRSEHLLRLLDGLLYGDGHKRESGSWYYYTVSRKLADQVQELAVRVGYFASLSPRKQRSGRPFGFGVTINPQRPPSGVCVLRRGLKIVPYSGMVGCLSVPPYGVMLMRRNGKLLWTGNSDLFRPYGPQSGEPPHARHVVPAASRILQPWWFRVAACDWGYAHEASILRACHAEDDDRLVIYDEIVGSGIGAEELGREFARRTLEELRSLENHAITLHLSHDAFHQRNDERSIAELILLGISSVVGPDFSYAPEILIEKAEQMRAARGIAANEESWAEAREEILARRQMGITIRKAQKTGVIAWQHVRSLLRWKPLYAEARYDPELAHRIFAEQGPERYAEYVRLFRDRRAEPLPKLLILDSCRRLVDAIPQAIHDEENPETVSRKHFPGKDSVDSLAYLAMGFRNEGAREPFSAVRDRVVSGARARNPNLSTDELVQIHRHLEARQKPKPSLIHVPRSGIRARFPALLDSRERIM